MKERIQYIGKTHTDKKETKNSAVNNKRLCNIEHSVYMVNVDFDDIIEMQDTGLTIARIDNKTSFLIIDIDVSTITYSKINEFYKDNPNITALIGTSNNPNKFHIYVKLDYWVNEDNYSQVVQKWFNKIHNEVCSNADIMNLDMASVDYRHCFFGCCQIDSYNYVIPNSTRLLTWKKKEHNAPIIYKDRAKVKHISLTSHEFCMQNNIGTVKEEKRFDVNLPCQWGRNRYYISEGNRWSWCRMIIPKLLMRYFYLNEKFKENWTIEDLQNTFEWVVNKNVIKPAEFIKSSDYKSLCLWLDEKYSRLKQLTYNEIEAELSSYFDVKTRQYKNRRYLLDTCKDIVQKYGKNINGENVVLFTDKEELLDLLESLSITERYFKDYISKTNGHYTLQFEVIPTRSDKGTIRKSNKHQEYLNTLKRDVNGVYLIDLEHMNNNAFRMYCSRNKIKCKVV